MYMLLCACWHVFMSRDCTQFYLGRFVYLETSREGRRQVSPTIKLTSWLHLYRRLLKLLESDPLSPLSSLSDAGQQSRTGSAPPCFAAARWRGGWRVRSLLREEDRPVGVALHLEWLRRLQRMLRPATACKPATMPGLL